MLGARESRVRFFLVFLLPWILLDTGWAGEGQAAPAVGGASPAPYTYLGFLRSSSGTRAFLSGETGLRIVQERESLPDGSTVVQIREDAVVLRTPDGQLVDALYRPRSVGAPVGFERGDARSIPNSPLPPGEVASQQEAGFSGSPAPGAERGREPVPPRYVDPAEAAEAAARFLAGVPWTSGAQPFVVMGNPKQGPHPTPLQPVPPGNEGTLVLVKPRKLSPEGQEALRRMIEASQGLVR
jgi:hypothetical protein